ncbi:general transcription repressor [Diaporthe eres]
MDGKFVATGCNKSAQIYDVISGEKKCVLQVEYSRNGGMCVKAVSFSPDGKYLATGGEDLLVRVWDIASCTIKKIFSGHEGGVYGLEFSRDGLTIVSNSSDRTVRLWDIETSSHIFTLRHEVDLIAVAISPDCQLVAAGTWDNCVRVWNMQGDPLGRFEGSNGHKNGVYSVAFSPNSKQLVSGSLDNTIKIWELNSSGHGKVSQAPEGGRCLKTFEGHKDFILSVAMDPDARWILSSSKDRTVQFWDPRTGQPQLMLKAHKNSVIRLSASPTGTYFATGSGDKRARIWKYTDLVVQ